MESLVSTFHLDVKLLLAQVVNFAIVFAVLYFFALKPLLKVMAERSGKIEKSLDDARKIEEKLALAEEEYASVIRRAKQEAAGLMATADKESGERREEAISRAKEEIGQIINAEKEKMRLEKKETLKEIRAEVADLVAMSVEKLLDKKLTNKDDQELIKKIVKQVK